MWRSIENRDHQEARAIGQIFIAALMLTGSLFFDMSAGSGEVGRLAHHIEFHVWAEMFFFAGVVYLLGIRINGRWRWSPALRMAAICQLAIMHLFLGISSGIQMLETPTFPVSAVALYSVVVLFTDYVVFFRSNLEDLRRRRDGN